MRAMRLPMRPQPMIPSVLPVSSTPGAQFFAPKPISRYLPQTSGRFFASAISSANACSATEVLFAPGVMVTATPRAFAASMSMLSTPTPCLEMSFRPGQESISSFVTSTMRTSSASAPRASAGSTGTPPLSPSSLTSCPAALSSAMPTGSICSVTTIFAIVRFSFRCASRAQSSHNVLTMGLGSLPRETPARFSKPLCFFCPYSTIASPPCQRRKEHLTYNKNTIR